MRSTFLGRTALASALLFAIGACGDSGSSGPDFDDEATTADTEAAADDAAGLMSDLSYALNFGSPNVFLSANASAKRVLARHPELGGKLAAGIRSNGISMPGLTAAPGAGFQLSAAVGCSVESSGTDGSPFEPYDGNSNGIPDDWHVKYVCTDKDTSDAENTITYSTTIEISAKENTASLHGYSSRLSYKIRIADEEQNAEGVDVTGTDALDIRAGSASNDYVFSVREYSTVAGETEEGSGGEERHVTFDPDGTITLGNDLPDGDLTFRGRQWYANTDDVSLSFSIQTTDPLAYDASCFDATEPPYTDGTIVGRLNGGAHSAMFTVDFTACGNYTITVDNTSDEPVVVTRRPPLGERAALGRR